MNEHHRKQIETAKDTIKTAKTFTSERLQKHIIVFGIIAWILILIVIYAILTREIRLSYALTAFILGIIVGMLFGRIYRIYWHPDDEQVVSRVDFFGALLICLYILMEIFRDDILALWVYGPIVSIVWFIFFTGTFCGRRIFMLRRIHTLLHEHKKI